MFLSNFYLFFFSYVCSRIGFTSDWILGFKHFEPSIWKETCLGESFLRVIPAEFLKKFQGPKATLGGSFKKIKWSNNVGVWRFKLGDRENFEIPGSGCSHVNRLPFIDKEIPNVGQKGAAACSREMLVCVLGHRLWFPACMEELCVIGCWVTWPRGGLKNCFVKILSGFFFSWHF